MNNYKFLNDGRKVVIIGQINQTEYIVQEIFVTESGDEIPSGEKFTTKTIHDFPVESYKAREEKQLSDKINKLKLELENIEREVRISKSKRQVNSDILKSSECAIKNILKKEDYTLLCDVVSGNIKFIVKVDSYRRNLIRKDNISLFDDKLQYNEYWRNNESRYEGLRLLSFYGKSNGELEYRVNHYGDGSGSSDGVMFIKSEEDLRELCLASIKKSVEDNIIDNYLYEAILYAESIGIIIPIEYKEKYNNHYIKIYEEEHEKNLQNLIKNKEFNINKLFK
jgi:hypothetical protein